MRQATEELICAKVALLNVCFHSRTCHHVAQRMVWRLLVLRLMPTDTAASKDLFFRCESCGTALVVDAAAAGMTLDCQHCGKAIIVPAAATKGAPPLASTEEEAELRRHLKENESQRTEITGYINQLNIQLHRWQLRLQTLNERNAELKARLGGLESTVETLPR